MGVFLRLTASNSWTTQSNLTKVALPESWEGAQEENGVIADQSIAPVWPDPGSKFIVQMANLLYSNVRSFNDISQKLRF